MRASLPLLLVVPLWLLAPGCASTAPTPTAEQGAALTETVLKIDGMTCASCEISIKIALTKLAGVSAVEVDYDTTSATIQHDPAQTSPQALADAVTNLGYPSTVQAATETSTALTGIDPGMAAICEMSCAASAESYSAADVVAQPGAKVGDLTRCPVSGVVFLITESHPTYQKNGQTWFTCCGGCMEQLKAATSRFIQG